MVCLLTREHPSLPVRDRSLPAGWNQHCKFIFGCWCGYQPKTPGAVAAVATSPVDVIKTRMMNQSAHAKTAGSTSVVVYRSTLHCAANILATEGLFGFFKGLMPNYLRIAPHTLTTFIVLEQLRKFLGLKSF
jgi:hypothetical protein